MIDPEQRLWSRKDIADHFGVSLTQVRRYLADPGFPKALRPLGGHPRWVQQEVKDWGVLWFEAA